MSKVVKRWSGPLLLCLMVVALPAGATNQGSTGVPGVGGTNSGVWWTPDATWRVAKASLNTYFTPVTNSLLNDYNPTDLAVLQYTTTSCTQETCAMDSDYGNNGLFGWNACYPGATSGSHPNQTCSNDWVRYNTNGSLPALSANVVACHELGHAVGLRHTAANSCMRNNPLPSNPDLTDHDRGHINSRY